MRESRSLLLDAIKEPACVTTLSAADWNSLLRQARDHELLARIGLQLKERGLWAAIPERARLWMEDVFVLAEHNQSNLLFEINRVMRAIGRQGGPIVVLKGGAYLLTGLPPSIGRIANDLDILVRNERLPEIREALLAGGWSFGEMRRYDKDYYETWMHEIPPMMHPEREMSIDIHHTIVPPTSRAHPDVDALWAASVEAGSPGLRILSPADLVLHSAVHLFNEDFRSCLRDLVDLHDLLGYFGKDDAFWVELDGRAKLHGFERVHFYLLRFTSRILGTAIPETSFRQSKSLGPPPGIAVLMELLLTRAFTPSDGGREGRFRPIALWCLYVRSHWLRMTPGLLARHLTIKLWFRIRDGILGARAAAA